AHARRGARAGHEPPAGRRGRHPAGALGTGLLRFGAARGFKDPLALKGVQLRVGEGLAGRVALERERLLIDDPAAVERAFAGADRLSREGFRSYVAVPLVSKGVLQGV